jgi:hypothetical protein
MPLLVSAYTQGIAQMAPHYNVCVPCVFCSVCGICVSCCFCVLVCYCFLLCCQSLCVVVGGGFMMGW